MEAKYICKKCNFECSKLSNWQNHIKTNKHMSNNQPQDFECTICAYNCKTISLMNKHKQTKKHITRDKHEPDSELMVIIKQLLTQNNELKDFIIEQATEHKKDTLEIVNKVIENAKPCNNTINGNVNNNNNQTNKFNINVFLNEQCKDAMNLSDFIKNIIVSREDLENNAQLGFVDGFSKILIDNLKLLSKTERPIHCTDVKRETMYIKDDDKWNKEEDSTKINKVIQEITRKSLITLLDWKAENPDDNDNDSEFSNLCIIIQKNSMAGYDRDTYFPKVARAVAKEVTISLGPVR